MGRPPALSSEDESEMVGMESPEDCPRVVVWLLLSVRVGGASEESLFDEPDADAEAAAEVAAAEEPDVAVGSPLLF